MPAISASQEDPSLLLDLSSEVKDEIASNLREYSDLLSLALTHTVWRDVIIPYHLHYRTIYSSEETRNPHWEHLLENRRRSDNVQVLHVGRQPQRWTPWYDPSNRRDYHAQYILSDAIKSFPNLRSFTFIGSDQDGFTIHKDDRELRLWSQLDRSCPYLEEVALEGAFACSGCILQAGDMRQRPSPLYNLKAKNLRAYRQVIKCHIWSHPYNPTPLHDMLAGFPQLRRLSLTASRNLEAADSSAFLRLRFPCLELFDFIHFPYPEDPEVLICFLAFHGELRKLNLHFMRLSLPSLFEAPVNASLLPQLTVLDTHAVLATGLFQLCSDQPLRPLASLRLEDVDLDDWVNISGLLEHVGRHLRNLIIQIPDKRNKEMHDILGLLANTCPQLRTLQIQMYAEVEGPRSDSVTEEQVAASSLWISHLPKLQTLVTLDIQAPHVAHALGFRIMPSRMETVTELVVSAPPTLRHLIVGQHTLLVRPVEEGISQSLLREIEQQQDGWFNPFCGRGTTGNKKWELYYAQFRCLRKAEAADW